MTESLSTLEEERILYALLTEAIELEGEDLEALLAGADPEHAEQVRGMLAEPAETRALPGHRFSIEAVADEPTLSPDTVIGPYQVAQVLGRGGMGRVYGAVQTRPVRRQVAIKVLRVHLADAKLRRRFAAEQQVMKRLDHPNVGKILDSGITDDGTPYIVMELILGRPIHRYCEQARATVEQRLRLFLDTCRGVAHAHRRFLLHRDIKPSNVLVAEAEGRPVPKLIDFGIAKSLGPTFETQITGGHAIGTPVYMSPEALGGGDEIDTRSDIFSLGVLLYRLLAGRLPWETEPRTFAAHLKERLESPPEAPSAVLAALDAAELEATARLCSTTPAGLVERVKGDLDAIVSRAMAEGAEDRYGSVDDLVADVTRHLEGKPVQARPASRSYVLGKALRRHRPAVLLISAAVAALVLALVGAHVDLREARQEIRLERERSEQVSGFLMELFEAEGRPSLDAEPFEAGPSETVSAKISEALAEARRLRDQGRHGEARDLAAESAAEAEDGLGKAAALEELAGIQRHLGAYSQAEANLREALEIHRRSGTGGGTEARLYFELGSASLEAWQFSAAVGYLEKAMPLFDEIHGPGSARTGVVRAYLALALSKEGRHEEAEAMLQGVADALLREAPGLGGARFEAVEEKADQGR